MNTCLQNKALPRKIKPYNRSQTKPVELQKQTVELGSKKKEVPSKSRVGETSREQQWAQL